MPDTPKPPANNADLPHSLVQQERERKQARDMLAYYYLMAPHAANNPAVCLSDALDLPAPK